MVCCKAYGTRKTKMIIILLIAFAFLFVALTNCDFANEENKNLTDINFAELDEIIDHMYETKNKLKSIDRLLLDLLVADEDNTQMVNLLWDDLTKQNNKYSFTVTSDNKHLIDEVQAEQERLRTSLLEDIDRINRLHSDINGNKNDYRK